MCWRIRIAMAGSGSSDHSRAPPILRDVYYLNLYDNAVPAKSGILLGSANWMAPMQPDQVGGKV